MSTVHTSDLDHGLASARHDTHSTFIEINRVDGEPSRYVVTFTHRYSVAAATPVEALAAATESLRAAMGTRDAKAERDEWLARTVRAEDDLRAWINSARAWQARAEKAEADVARVRADCDEMIANVGKSKPMSDAGSLFNNGVWAQARRTLNVLSDYRLGEVSDA